MTETNYPIGDFLIRIKNAALVNKDLVEVRKSNLIKDVALSLEKAGILRDVSEKGNYLTVSLGKKNKKPVLLGIKLISKPGIRVYKSSHELKKIKSSSFLIVSTPKGIMTSKEALKENVGGEIIAEVW